MSRVLRLALLLLLIPSWDQSTAQITGFQSTVGAPFTANWTRTIVEAGKVRTTSGTMARKSDGSTYIFFAPNADSGTKDSPLAAAGFVLIQDMKQHRAIMISPAMHLFSINNGQPSPIILPDAYIAKFLMGVHPAGTKEQNGEWEITALGARQIEGLRTFGSSQINPTGRSFEKWYAPQLDINLEMQGHQVTPSIDSKLHITSIRLGEPDEVIFRIPAGYTEELRPPSRPR